MTGFELSPDLKEIRELALKFARNEMMPLCGSLVKLLNSIIVGSSVSSPNCEKCRCSPVKTYFTGSRCLPLTMPPLQSSVGVRVRPMRRAVP